MSVIKEIWNFTKYSLISMKCSQESFSKPNDAFYIFNEESNNKLLLFILAY